MPASFGAQLLAWHRADPRPLPWGEGPRSPYHIWIAEVILQQTRIEQGAPYLHRFLSRFPDVGTLASAPEYDVLKAWEGLGYYSRARNLHKAARVLVDQWAGRFPEKHEDILALPGIGAYTAAAIASFAFGQPYAVVDGNVKRVLARYSGIEDPVDTARGHQKITQEAQRLLANHPPAEFNQAIMNLGALVCTPTSPGCDACPLSKNCQARLQGRQTSFPVRSPRSALRDRFLHFVVLLHGRSTMWVHRTEKDIWKGLYTPPCLETASSRKPPARILAGFLDSLGAMEGLVPAGSSGTYEQVLSHQHIHARFHFFELTERPAGHDPAGWYTRALLDELPKPRIIHTWLSDSSTGHRLEPQEKAVRRSWGR